MGVGAIYLEVKRLGSYTGHSSPSRVKDTDEWHYIPNPPYDFVACSGITSPLELMQKWKNGKYRKAIKVD
jgi:hypothetical protein